MKPQSYKNHIRFYTPHHFVFYPLMSALFGASVYFIYSTDEKLIWTFITLLFLAVIWVAYMMRQHYALTLQNRIVRLEFQYRYFALTGKHLNIENLDDSQLFALRFCSDAELPEMLQRTVTQHLSGTAIKKAIVNWKGDYERV